MSRRKGRSTGRPRGREKRTPRDERQVELLPGLAEPASGGEPAHVASGEVASPPNGAASPDVVSEWEGDGSVTAERETREREIGSNGAPAGGSAGSLRPTPKTTTERKDPADASAPVGEVPPSPRPQGIQLTRARDLVEEGRVEEAVELYRSILAESPENLKAHHNLGVLFDELGQSGRALDHLEEALRLQPDNVAVLTNYASALTAAGRFEAADEQLRRALRLSPDDPAARLAAGVLSFRRGSYAQAEAELRWVCERDPGNGIAFYYRAEALNRVARFSEAEPVMLRAAELMPTDPRPSYTLGHLYDRQERHEEAARMYRLARDLQGR